jgi:DNA-binding GntR family transcriptional regulator
MELKRAQKIAETLEHRVFSGEYQDGERLDEHRLADAFRVSRTPIREALQVLVSSGMAQQIPRRGVFVRQPGPVELMEMFETMGELEAACGRFAAARMTDTALSQLIDANERCQQALNDNDHAGYYAQNETFHHLIYHGSGNSYLEKQAILLQTRLKPYRRMQLRFRGRLKQSMSEHVTIVNALQNGDADGAATALRGHVAIQGEKFHQLMANLKDKRAASVD